MFINNRDIKEFKAKLMSRNISPSEFSVFNEWGDKSITPFINEDFTYKYKTLTFMLDLICSDSNELEKIKSSLIKEIAVATIKFDDIEYSFRGFLDGSPTLSYIMPGNETIEFKMLVIAEGNEESISINKVKSSSFKVTGNIDAPCIIELIPTIAMSELDITGFGKDKIRLKNLVANNKIIIDGNNQIVTSNGVNKFKDTELWDFPYLKPGENKIDLSSANCNMTIRYKPRLI